MCNRLFIIFNLCKTLSTYFVIFSVQVVPQTDPNAVTYSSMIPQLAAHVSAIQLGTPGSVSALDFNSNQCPNIENRFSYRRYSDFCVTLI